MKSNHYTKLEIEKFEKVWNINFINSITGFKPANLIATRSSNSIDNVAIFSSVVHLGSNPPLIGFTLRPQDERITDTYKNILDTSLYSINSVGKKFL